ncbi:MAG: Inner membrane protein YrbG [bacterium ADurb.Bin429]|nr:MAG: Inner membrane protein YrbG [bacterium ADurb.Bin429]
MVVYLLLLAGITCAAIGGELFVRGIVGLARWARVSAGIIAATIAAFATSSPELAVAMISALEGMPQLSFGNVLGSNVLNIAVILGITLLFGGLRPAPLDVRREMPTAFFIPAVTGALIIDGMMSRLDGLILLLVFGFWLTLVILDIRRQRQAAAEVLGETNHNRAIVFCIVGLLFLMLSGRLIVSSAQQIALAWGIPPFIIGAVIVALGTTVPELATALIARLRGHDEVGLGTLLGSNIYNGAVIVAIVAIIAPFAVSWQAARMILLFGILALVAAIPFRRGVISAWQGVVLLLLYAGYLLTTLLLTPR